MDEERDNIIAFRRTSQLNIGIVICVIIFVYVLFRLLSYVTSEEVTVYEVKDGSIVSDNTYRALIIRREQIVPADRSGYVYYFAVPGSRVGVRSLIYAVDEDGGIVSSFTNSSGTGGGLSESAYQRSRSAMAVFVNEYQSLAFRKTYTFKDQLNDTLNALQVDALMQEHASEIEAAIANNTYHTYYPARPGLVSYTIDGLENVTENDFDPAVFDAGETSHSIKSSTQVSIGDPAYKLITSDDWKLVVPVELAVRDALAEESAIQLTFESDGMKAWASCSILEKDEVPYLVLSLDDSMERYADLRFIGIELMLDEQSGLKIPNTAIVEKQFFTIPKAYFIKGGNAGELGVLRRTDGGNEYVVPNVYKETADVYYIDENEIQSEDVLLLPDSLDTYTVGKDVDELEGVYNINKGYAVFKQIEPLRRNEDYTIIKTGTPYGLAMYDHIALQGDRVTENEIIGR